MAFISPGNTPRSGPDGWKGRSSQASAPLRKCGARLASHGRRKPVLRVDCVPAATSHQGVDSMNDPRLKIFSIVFGVFYLPAFYFDVALFRYYPEVREFHWMRTDNLGPVILWYGWIATTALA